MTSSTMHEPYTPAEQLEEDAADVGVAAGEALRAVEVGGVVLLGLLLCPPLAILAVLVGVPLLVTALILGVIAVPYLLVRHLRAHHRRHRSL